MNAAHRLAGVRAAAAAEGLLPMTDTPPPPERPWPVVLLTAFGAWLAALPLGAALGLLLEAPLQTLLGPYLIGAVALGSGIAVLRAKRAALFLEQIAIPWMLAGAGMLAYALSRDLPDQFAALVLSVLALAVAAALPQAWLRALLGAAAASCAAMAVAGGLRAEAGWWALHAVLAVALVAMAAQGRGLSARAAVWLEAVLPGWLAVTLAGLAAWSGWTFMVAGALPLHGSPGGGPDVPEPLYILSALQAAAAAGLVMRQWRGVRRVVLGLVALALVGLAGTMAGLGGVLLAAAACAVTGRSRLLAAAGVAAAWIVGAFYYQLQWPLAAKGLVLVAVAAVLALGAWLTKVPPLVRAMPVPGRHFAMPVVFIPFGVILCLVLVNVGIREKEAVLAHGRSVLVALAPADPRSLMQGDFMRLNFAIPSVPVAPGPHDLPPHVVMQVDERGVATPLRVELPGEEAPVLSPRDVRIALVPKDGRWVLVTDAWFFKEGESTRFEAAKYGEFKVNAAGEALLVGLRDAQLAPIAP